MSARRTGRNGGSSVCTITLAAPRTAPGAIDRHERGRIALLAGVDREVGRDGRQERRVDSARRFEAEVAGRAAALGEESLEARDGRRVERPREPRAESAGGPGARDAPAAGSRRALHATGTKPTRA